MMATRVSITFTLPNQTRAEELHDAVMAILEAISDVTNIGSSIGTTDDATDTTTQEQSHG